jgi:hypothetical protein
MVTPTTVIKEAAMPNTTRIIPAIGLALGLIATAAAAPSMVVPRIDAQSADHSDAIIARSQQPGTADCRVVARADEEPREDRLATLMMHHSIVSRLALGQDAVKRLADRERIGAAARHDDPVRSCG